MSGRADYGFTLVENLVALLLLAIGLLALTSAVASVTRLSGVAGARVRGAVLGGSVVETLVAGSCAAVSGDSSDGRFSLRWSVDPSGPGADVLVTLRSPTPRGWRTDTLAARLPCGR